MAKDRIGTINFILSSVELLRALKTIYPYSALSEKTGLAKPVLCRYVKGTNLPSEGTAIMLNQSLSSHANLKLLLAQKLKQDPEGYVDSTTVSCDHTILIHAGREILTRYRDKGFTKVLTAATDGIPLASAAAMRLGVPLVIAKRSKEVGIRSFIEESYVSSSPTAVTTLYIPKRAISPGDQILIVDNIVRTGRTINVLISLVKKVKAVASNIYILIIVGGTWHKTLTIPTETHLDVVLRLEDSSNMKIENKLPA